MKSKTILAAIVFMLSLGAAHAQTTQTQFYARFVYDDGSAVSGGLQIFQGVAPNGTNILGMTLDSTGRVHGSVPLNPSLQYYGALTFTDPNGKLTSLSYAELPFCTATCAGPVLAALPNNEVDVTIAKATDMVAGVTLGPVPAPSSSLLPQIKFANCASVPAARTGGTSDSGGGLVVGYIVTGQKFSCTVSVPAAGSYTLAVRAASGSGAGTLHFEYPAGTKVGGEISVPFTGSNWDTYQTFTVATPVTLPAGNITLTTVIDSAGLNLNWFN